LIFVAVVMVRAVAVAVAVATAAVAAAVVCSSLLGLLCLAQLTWLALLGLHWVQTMLAAQGKDGRGQWSLVGGPAHLFPPFFFILARRSFFSGGSANTKKQTDAEQIESGFLPR
jgi:hypothetical protein